MTLLNFLWIDFNAVYIATTATNNSTCLLILEEICREMTMLQQVEVVVIFMPYFRILCVVIAQIWSAYEGASNIFQRSSSKEWRHE